jgi:hypothetical protein
MENRQSEKRKIIHRCNFQKLKTTHEYTQPCIEEKYKSTISGLVCSLSAER